MRQGSGSTSGVEEPEPRREAAGEAAGEADSRVSRAKARLGWYGYPLLYFTVSSVVLLHRLGGRGGVGPDALGVAWRNLALVPSITWAVGVSVLIGVDALLARVRGRAATARTARGDRVASAGDRPVALPRPRGLAGLFVGALRLGGLILIVGGAAVAVWIARPYLTLIASSGHVAELERKVALDAVSGDRIVIPSVLVDSPVLRGSSERNLARGVVLVDGSAAPGEGGNVVLEGHNLAEIGVVDPDRLFSLLELVGKGARVFLFFQGRRFEYRVVGKSYRDLGAPGFYEPGVQGETLTMITCVSTWSPTIYTQRRTVVVAVREG